VDGGNRFSPGGEGDKRRGNIDESTGKKRDSKSTGKPSVQVHGGKEAQGDALTQFGSAASFRKFLKPNCTVGGEGGDLAPESAAGSSGEGEEVGWIGRGRDTGTKEEMPPQVREAPECLPASCPLSTRLNAMLVGGLCSFWPNPNPNPNWWVGDAFSETSACCRSLT